MSQILELAKLPQNQCVAQVEIWAGRIDSQFDPQWSAKGEFLAQLGFADYLCAALLEERKCFVRLHVAKCRDRRVTCSCLTIRAPVRSSGAFDGRPNPSKS